VVNIGDRVKAVTTIEGEVYADKFGSIFVREDNGNIHEVPTALTEFKVLSEWSIGDVVVRTEPGESLSVARKIRDNVWKVAYFDSFPRNGSVASQDISERTALSITHYPIRKKGKIVLDK
jgi:hypothetical protein